MVAKTIDIEKYHTVVNNLHSKETLIDYLYEKIARLEAKLEQKGKGVEKEISQENI